MAFQKTKPIDGSSILIKIDGKPMGLQTAGSLNIEREPKEVTFKKIDRATSIYKDFTAGQITWTVENSAYWLGISGDTEMVSYRDILNKVQSVDSYEVEIVVEFVQGLDTITITGQALISNLSFDITNSNEDLTYSCSLQGTGAFTVAEVLG
ncbi:phage tail tube protein [Carboxylicivirga sp. RSCT41]|uniref:phage tail tube protein n=1 Tax=Carboxylicivirga agarovorans TaxID=3417570 RepID=UPI003D32D695